MMKLLTNQPLLAQGLPSTQMLGTLLDGAARHTAEGYAFQAQAARDGFRAAVRARDEPFATDPARHPGSPDGVGATSSGPDPGASTFQG
jgi:enoyl-CoA hydratase